MKKIFKFFVVLICVICLLCSVGCSYNGKYRNNNFGGGSGGSSGSVQDNPFVPPMSKPNDDTNNVETDVMQPPDASYRAQIYSQYEQILFEASSIVSAGSPPKQYTVYDINKDGLYELIVEGEGGVYTVYTDFEGTATSAGVLYAKYGLGSYDGNGIYSSTGGTGFLEVYRTILNGPLLEEPQLHMMHDVQPNFSVYKIEGRIVTEAEYEAYRRSHNFTDLSDKMCAVSDLRFIKMLR